MTLTLHTFGAITKYSGVAINTRPAEVPTSVVGRIDGCEVSALIRRFGSPLFVVSEARLRQEYQALVRALRSRYPSTELAYSYKTNYIEAVRAVFHDEGAAAEVVSGLEYDLALRVGVPGHRIIFNGPYKTEAELRRAVKDRAWVNVDSFDELALLDDIARGEGRRTAVGVRVTAAVGDHPWEKFGFSLEAGLADEACRRVAASRYLRLAGLHVHLGTDLPEPDTFGTLLALVLPLMARAERRYGVSWKVLDLGGGLPNRHRYARSRPGITADDVFPAFAGAIVGPLTAGFRRIRSRPRLVLEPGRALVEHAVFLLTTVVATKRLPSGVKAAVLDAGVNVLPTAYYTALDITATEARPLSVEEVTLFGPLCMQVDCLAVGLRLPPLQRGSHLAVRNCGAYTESQSMPFIQPRPPVVMVANGHPELIRGGESVEDFIGRDRVPDRLRRLGGTRR
jgi:diaminopimelate decarboxylase